MDSSGNQIGSATVDQEGIPGKWVSIGTYNSTTESRSVHPVITNDATHEEINKHCKPGQQWCKLVVDGIRYTRRGTVYLPAVRSRESGWTTTLYISNNGAGEADVRIDYLLQNGAIAEIKNFTVPRLGVKQVIPPSGIGDIQAAIVDSTQNVSVVVTNQRSSPEIWSAYNGTTNPSTEVNIPLVHRNNYRWYSHVYIQNTQRFATNISANFYSTDGLQSCQRSYSIPPYGQIIVATSDVSCLNPAGYVGSLKINSDQKIAVTSSQGYFTVDSNLTQFMESTYGEYIGTPLNVPLVHNNNYGYVSGLDIQNVSNFRHDITIDFMPGGTPSGCYHLIFGQIRPYRSALASNPGQDPCPPFLLSALLRANEALAANIIQVKSGGLPASDYEVTETGREFYLPLVKMYWDGGFVIYNHNSVAIQVKRSYYSTNGTFIDEIVSWVSSYSSLIVTNEPSPNFSGSCRIVSNNEPVSIVVNHNPSTSGDYSISYSGKKIK